MINRRYHSTFIQTVGVSEPAFASIKTKSVNVQIPKMFE